MVGDSMDLQLDMYNWIVDKQEDEVPPVGPGDGQGGGECVVDLGWQGGEEGGGECVVGSGLTG